MRFAGAVCLLALAMPAAAAPLVLEGIDVLAEHGPTVRLRLSQPAVAQTRTLAAEGGAPDRIYLDLPGTMLAPGTPALVTGAGALLRVRTGQFDRTTARVVLDLAHAVPFTVTSTAESVTVTLAPVETAVAAAPPPPTPSPPRVASAPPQRAPRVPPPGPPAASLPPPPPSAPPRAAPPPVSTVVVLDPGHGGRDPGAAGVGGVLEKDVVLDLARLLAERLLARLHVNVLLTRVDDSFIPIDRRLTLPGDGAALFISLHANACHDASARGLEVFYGGGGVRAASTPADDPRAALLGRSLRRALAARVGRVRGEARPGPFGILLRNPVPSALVEIGYLTHPDDAARAQDARYQGLLADALVDGVASFLRASVPPL